MTTTAPVKQDAWKHTFIDPCENENFNFNQRDIENNTWARVDMGFLFERLTQ